MAKMFLKHIYNSIEILRLPKKLEWQTSQPVVNTVRDIKRIKRDKRYFSRYIIEYIIICNTCFKWNSQSAIIPRSFSRIDKRKLATRWKSADSILTSVVAHRLNDNEHTFEYSRENSII